MIVEGKCEVGLEDTQKRRQYREKPREWDEILEGAAHREWKGLEKKKKKTQKHYREVKPREVKKVRRVPGY